MTLYKNLAVAPRTGLHSFPRISCHDFACYMLSSTFSLRYSYNKYTIERTLISCNQTPTKLIQRHLMAVLMFCICDKNANRSLVVHITRVDSQKAELFNRRLSVNRDCSCCIASCPMRLINRIDKSGDNMVQLHLPRASEVTD